LGERFQAVFPRFPSIVEREFRKLSSAVTTFQPPEVAPKTWKTIGDEIVFCVRLQSREHLRDSVCAFLKALDEHGGRLDASGGNLDIKCAAWVAAFPVPNLTIEVSQQAELSPAHAASDDEQSDEALERAADNSPERHDFLGAGMDAGFRLAALSAPDKLILSAELALLLTDPSGVDLPNVQFAYHGREVMKGVIRERPYPIISIDAERNLSRREVRKRERKLMHTGDADRPDLWYFLQALIRDEELEDPVLPLRGRHSEESSLPASYLQFRESWKHDLKESEQRNRLMLQGEEVEETYSAPDPESLSAIEEHHMQMLKRIEGE
jgi:hypothetical protein